MKLLLIRHAATVPRGTPGVPDGERQLTADGEAEFRSAAGGLAWIVDPPDVLLSSPLARARATAGIAARTFGRLEPRIEPALAHGTLETILAALASHGSTATMALVGHEPLLSALLARLLGVSDSDRLGFEKGGAALVDLPDGLASAGRLVWLLDPRILRTLAGRRESATEERIRARVFREERTFMDVLRDYREHQDATATRQIIRGRLTQLLAVVDLGSTAVRFRLARVAPGAGYRVLVQERVERDWTMGRPARCPATRSTKRSGLCAASSRATPPTAAPRASSRSRRRRCATPRARGAYPARDRPRAGRATGANHREDERPRGPPSHRGAVRCQRCRPRAALSAASLRDHGSGWRLRVAGWTKVQYPARTTSPSVEVPAVRRERSAGADDDVAERLFDRTAGREDTTQVDEIKRTTGPQTTNGRRWEVQLSATPPGEWLDLFKVSGESSAKALPKRVEFDRASAIFTSDEDQVEHWIESIDKWIASTNARYLMTLERVRRERFDRIDAETKEKERVQRLNDRFKDL